MMSVNHTYGKSLRNGIPPCHVAVSTRVLSQNAVFRNIYTLVSMMSQKSDWPRQCTDKILLRDMPFKRSTHGRPPLRLLLRVIDNWLQSSCSALTISSRTKHDIDFPTSLRPPRGSCTSTPCRRKPKTKSIPVSNPRTTPGYTKCVDKCSGSFLLLNLQLVYKMIVFVW